MKKLQNSFFFGLFFFITLIISGCGDSNVARIKDGTLGFDNSVTVGDALEGNQFLKNPKWRSFEDKQKRIYVEFTADLDMPRINKILAQTHRNIKFLSIPLQIRIQFTLNKDNTFNATSLDFPSPLEVAPIQDIQRILVSLYKNELPPFVGALLKKHATDGLNHAIKGNKIENVKLYIQYGADPNSGLALASYSKKREIVLLLLKSGANINRQFGGRTLLMNALGQKDNNFMKFLIDNGANINAQIDGGKTSLMLAGSNLDQVLFLLAHGADPNIRDTAGFTALTLFSYHSSSIDTVKALIRYGADVNTQSKYGDTPLFLAAKSNNLEIAKLLIAHGADPSMKIDGDKTAKDYVSYNEELKILLSQ